MTVEWRAVTNSMATSIDSMILGRDPVTSVILGAVYAHLRKQEEKEAPDSTDVEGKSWRDRPPLL